MRKMLLAIVLLAPTFASAEYYVEVYGYGLRARASHSFAAFYGEGQRVDISHLPTQMRGLFGNKVPAFGVHPATNHTLEETLGMAGRRRIHSSGLREIDAQTFHNAQAYAGQLNAGLVPYHGLGIRPATHAQAPNCVHAITNPAGDFNSGIRRGPGLVEPIIQHLQHPTYPQPYYQPVEVQRQGLLPGLRARLGR